MLAFFSVKHHILATKLMMQSNILAFTHFWKILDMIV